MIVSMYCTGQEALDSIEIEITSFGKPVKHEFVSTSFPNPGLLVFYTYI